MRSSTSRGNTALTPEVGGVVAIEGRERPSRRKVDPILQAVDQNANKDIARLDEVHHRD
jgi:hypothetical protein